MQVKYTNFGDKSKGILNKLVFFVFQKMFISLALIVGAAKPFRRNGGESRNPE